MPQVQNIVKQGLFERTAGTDLTSGTFYAHLLTAMPAATVSTVAGLTLASGTGYSPQTLSGRAIADAGVGENFTLSNPTWSGLYTTAATPIVGWALCKQSGGSPASTDAVIGCFELTNNQTVAACTTTSGSVTVTSSNSFPSGITDMPISGTNIPSNTTILERADANTLRLSARATGSASGSVTATIAVPSPYTPATAAPGANLALQFPSGVVLTTNV